jgi:hypothetical protein
LDVGNQGGAGEVGALGSIGVAHPNTEIGQPTIATGTVASDRIRFVGARKSCGL